MAPKQITVQINVGDAIRNIAKRKAQNPEGIQRGDFVTATADLTACRDGVGKRLGIILEVLSLPQNGPEVAARMIYWFCCKRTMIGDLRFCRRVNAEKARREIRGDAPW